MPIPTIPAGLCVAAQGYSFGEPSGARRTQVAGGAGRYGMSFYRGTTFFNVTLVLTDAQMRVWTLFYQRRVALGTLPFSMELDSGMGVQPHECQIVPGSYQSALNQTVWVVSFQVEAVSSAYGEPQEVPDLELDYWENTGRLLGPMLDRLTIFANEDVLILNEVQP